MLWCTNVLLFGLWYWEIDRGGPAARRRHERDYPDFLFPQMSDPRWAPKDWMPRLIDYLYVSLTNATAFSPTDTMPLTPTRQVADERAVDRLADHRGPGRRPRGQHPLVRVSA